MVPEHPAIALFLATSGHSGVDRVMGNLMDAFTARGLRVDLLHVRGHGPHREPAPPYLRVVDLGSAHVYSSLPPLVRYLRRERPASLLCDKHKVNLTALRAVRLAGVDTQIVVRTGTTVSADLAERGGLSRYLHRRNVRRWYPRARSVVVPSSGAADDLARFCKLDRKLVTAIPNPIVGPDLLAKAAEPVDHPWFLEGAEVPVILGVGELGSRKDFATLIRAFAILRAERQLRLVIFGRGRQQQALKQLAADLSVADDVSLPGFTTNPYAYMMRASLFVLCSLWEGLPTVLIEALAVGTPVVSTNCPSGPAEILEDGRYGPLVPVGDATALAEAMRTTLDRPLPSDALRKAAERYRIQVAASRYLRALGLA